MQKLWLAAAMGGIAVSLVATPVAAAPMSGTALGLKVASDTPSIAESVSWRRGHGYFYGGVYPSYYYPSYYPSYTYYPYYYYPSYGSYYAAPYPYFYSDYPAYSYYAYAPPYRPYYRVYRHYRRW